MALLKTSDLLKRNNAELIIDIVTTKSNMTVGKKADGATVRVHEIKIGSLCNPTSSCLVEYCIEVKGAPPEIMTDWGNWLPVTRFFKDPRFVPKSTIKGAPEVRDKAYQQRQEASLVNMINQWATPIRLSNFRWSIVRAEQAPEFGPHGKENLVDVVVWDDNDYSYNVSCKMSCAADLGSGGMAGLQKTVPDLVDKVYAQVQNDIYDAGLREGEVYDIRDIPTFMYEIPFSYAYRMFEGSEMVGGRIDYIYIGPSDVDFNGTEFNGRFWSVEEYAKKTTYYLRLRKRDVFENKVRVNFSKLNSHKLPCIFTTGPGDFSAARFVLDNRPYPKAKIKTL